MLAKHENLTAQQANAIFTIAEDAIVSVNAEQIIILFNEGAEKLFGYQSEEVLGQPRNVTSRACSPSSRKTYQPVRGLR